DTQNRQIQLPAAGTLLACLRVQACYSSGDSQNEGGDMQTQTFREQGALSAARQKAVGNTPALDATVILTRWHFYWCAVRQRRCGDVRHDHASAAGRGAGRQCAA